LNESVAATAMMKTGDKGASNDEALLKTVQAGTKAISIETSSKPGSSNKRFRLWLASRSQSNLTRYRANREANTYSPLPPGLMRRSAGNHTSGIQAD
jgi:hypothetical protein